MEKVRDMVPAKEVILTRNPAAEVPAVPAKPATTVFELSKAGPPAAKEPRLMTIIDLPGPGGDTTNRRSAVNFPAL